MAGYTSSVSSFHRLHSCPGGYTTPLTFTHLTPKPLTSLQHGVQPTQQKRDERGPLCSEPLCHPPPQHHLLPLLRPGSGPRRRPATSSLHASAHGHRHPEHLPLRPHLRAHCLLRPPLSSLMELSHPPPPAPQPPALSDLRGGPPFLHLAHLPGQSVPEDLRERWLRPWPPGLCPWLGLRSWVFVMMCWEDVCKALAQRPLHSRCAMNGNHSFYDDSATRLQIPGGQPDLFLHPRHGIRPIGKV